MSTYLTQKQLTSFFTALLNANSRTDSWASLLNPNTQCNQGLNQNVFMSLTKDMKDLLKTILKEFGLRFNGNQITFPEGYHQNIPEIVKQFMKCFQLPVDGAVAEESPRAFCGGGGAVAPSGNSSEVSGARGWNLQPSNSCKARDVGQQHVPRDCPNSGGSCQFHMTWGGCRNIHPDNELKNGDISTLHGRVIQVCRNGDKCPHGENCSFPHPANASCVIESKTLRSGIRIDLVRVCRFF